MDDGFESNELKVVKEDEFETIGPVTLATLDINYEDQRVQMELEALRLGGDWYRLQGQSPDTQEAVSCELASVNELIQSIVLTQ